MYLKLLLTFSLVIFIDCELNIRANSLEGTENVHLNLTDKQLSLQKYLSWLTFLQSKNDLNTTSKFGWLDWELNYNNDQTNVDSTRYPLAFIGYAAASIVYKTPSYRQVSVRIVDNVIQRLLEQHQYEYIQLYWSHLSSFPDPVIHENIMYSGHLAMLIALYESLSGDFKYTNIGWNFTWPGYANISYTAKKLMDVIHDQVMTEETGGIACEPNSIFVLCNDHHRIAFQLYDAMHGTNYSKSNIKWEKWIKKHARAPDILPNGDYRYFRIIYYKPIHDWIPLYGTAGNDAWALVFMNAWISDRQFAAHGYEQMSKSSQWKRPAHDEEYLDTGLFGRISNLNTWLASSFYPAVESQYSTPENSRNKSVHVYNWFERNFGAFTSRQINKCNNTYYYKITDDSYRPHAVANLLLSMITDNRTFIDMYTRPFYSRYEHEPELVDVDYPNLHVKYAFYDPAANKLSMALKTDCSTNVSNTSFSLLNVVSFKWAILTVNDRRFDISDLANFDSIARVLKFSQLNVDFRFTNIIEIKF